MKIGLGIAKLPRYLNQRRFPLSEKFTKESLKKDQEDAQWAYDKAREKFFYSMLELVFLKIKTLLNEKGVKKVSEMDEKRNNNENFGVDFSQKTWEALAESWNPTEADAMSKIAELYGLVLSDLDMSKIPSVDDEDIEENLHDLDDSKC